MKKSLIFITVISLLMTLLIPNIALAQDESQLSIEKTGDVESVSIGDTINYTITVTNNWIEYVGSGYMSNIHVVDEMLGINETTLQLAPGASEVFTETYGPITEADLPGPIVNTATATWPFGEANLDGVFTDSADYSVSIEITPEPEPLCTVSIKPGCAGEETTVTGTVAGWTGVPDVIDVWFWLDIYNIDTDSYMGKSFYTDDTTKDPFSGSLSYNLTAGNYEARIAGTAYDGENYYDCGDWIEFVVVECPAPEPEPIIPEPIIPEPCYCSLVVQIRDETGHPINGAVLKVDGIEKKTVNGDARWDNLKCDTSYEVREISPEKRTEGIHLGDCGERSTMRIVHKIEEEVVEEVIIPEAGLDLNFTTLYAIAGLGILRILLGIKRKRK